LTPKYTQDFLEKSDSLWVPQEIGLELRKNFCSVTALIRIKRASKLLDIEHVHLPINQTR
jgi:hypothetical protein